MKTFPLRKDYKVIVTYFIAVGWLSGYLKLQCSCGTHSWFKRLNKKGHCPKKLARRSCERLLGFIPSITDNKFFSFQTFWYNKINNIFSTEKTLHIPILRYTYYNTIVCYNIHIGMINICSKRYAAMVKEIFLTCPKTFII